MSSLSKMRLVLAIFLVALAASALFPVRAQDKKIIIRQLDNQVVQAPSVAAAFKEFQKKYPNVELEHEPVANYNEVIQFALKGDTPPDIFVTNITDGPQTQSLVDAKAFYSLDKFKDWPEFLKTFPDSALAVQEGTNKFGDQIISMKYNADLWWHQYYLNLDLYEKAGIVGTDGKPIIPTTWKQVVENAYKIKEKTGAYGFSLAGANTGWMTFFNFTCWLSSVAYGPRGFGYDMRTGEFKAASNECIKTIYKDLLKMRDDKITPPDLLTLDDEPNRALFAEGKTATIMTGTWAITGWEQTHKDFKNYTSIPVPLVNTDKPLHWYPASPASRMFSISASAAKDPEKLAMVWEWYKFMYSASYATISSEMNKDVSIFTPGDPTKYANQQNRGYFDSARFFATHPEPLLTLRNADVGKLQQTLVGPNEGEILIGLYSGQLKDIDAALADLDKRYTEALDKAIADAQAAGAKITKEDFIVRDWDPTKPYDAPFGPGYYPGKK
jgi:ABC-type glycerol-3-phosphate transport system substrate-binding protein